MNHVIQDALPAFSARGAPYTRWRAEAMDTVHFEQDDLWFGGGPRVRQRVAGGVHRLAPRRVPGTEDLVRKLMGRRWDEAGLHRPLDGVMKDRTVLIFV